MKQRMAKLVTLGLLCSLLLTGCGGSEAASGTEAAQSNTETTAEEAVAEETTEETAEETTEEAEEEVEMVTLDIRNLAVTSLGMASDELLAFEENGKVGLMDDQGNIVEEAKWDWSNDFRLQDGTAVYLGNTIDDKTYEYVLYTYENGVLEEVWSHTSDWYISNYQEGIITMRKYDNSATDIITKIENGEVIEAWGMSEENFGADNYGGSSDYVNGFSVIYTGSGYGEDNEKNRTNVMNEYGQFASLTENFITNRFPLGDDGWVWGWFTDDYNTPYAYNIYTQERVSLAFLSDFYYQKDAGDRANFMTRDNLMVVVADEDVPAEAEEDAQPIKRIFNLKTQDYVNDQTYAQVWLEQMHDGYILYETFEGKRGFLDAKTFEDMGVLFDTATFFDENGYALVQQDGSFYAVNRDFEIVSAAMEGTSAYYLKDNQFCVEQEDGTCHWVKIK